MENEYTNERKVIGITYVNGEKHFVLDYYEIQDEEGTIFPGLFAYEIVNAAPINQDLLPDAEAVYDIPYPATGIPVYFQKTVPETIKVLKEFTWEDLNDDSIDEPDGVFDNDVFDDDDLDKIIGDSHDKFDDWKTVE